MTIKHLTVIIAAIMMIMLINGCGRAAVSQNTISIQEKQWNEKGSDPKDILSYSPIKKGDILYNANDTKISVKSINDNKVILAIEGYMVEPNENGTINLNADPLEKIEIKRGESKEIDSQTMDAGFKLYITYK